MKNDTILIRSIEEKDIQIIQSWNFDEVTSAFFSSRLPISELEQKKWFENQLASSTKKKLIIENIADHKPIGMIGLMNIDQVNKNCEIGITIGEKQFVGKNVAKDAMMLALDFLFNQFNFHMVYLVVMEDNKRGVAFFEKIGFKKNGILRDFLYKDGSYRSCLWMNITKTEFSEK